MQVKENAGLEVSYEAESIEFFPFVGVKLNQVKVSDSHSNQSFEAEFETLQLSVTWKSLLLKNITIEKLILKKGEINLNLEKRKTKNENKDEDVTKIFFQSIKSLRTQSIDLQELSLYFFEKNNDLKEELFIKEFNYEQSGMVHSFTFQANHRGGNVSSSFTIHLDGSNTVKEQEWTGELKLQNYSPLSFRKYYQIFKTQSFDSVLLNGDFYFTKSKSSNHLQCVNSFSILNLNFKGIPSSPLLQIQSRLGFHLDTYTINFYSVELQQGKDLIGSTNGYLEIQNKLIKLYLEVNAKQVRLEKIIPYILSFIKINMDEKGDVPNFEGLLRIQSQNTYFHDYHFIDSKVDLMILDTDINLKIFESEFYGGKVSGNGKIDAKSKILYDFSIHCENINSYNLIQRYSKSEYISGKLQGDFRLISEGDEEEVFFNELKISGNFQVSDGKLLGYANLFKPILSIGKYLNWKGPKGESTEFLSLSGNFLVQKKTVELKSIQLVGVGMDARGSGRIGFNHKIDLKFHVGLGGIAGKAISIPILYKGIMPNNTAYIDPIWLGSVYVGTTFLGGPVGGVAGSAVSEYIGSGIEKVKQIFSIFNSKE